MSTAAEDPTVADGTTETQTPQTSDIHPISLPEEPSNPALKEPDVMAIVRKGSAIATSVTEDRKLELLVQARAERRQWVHQVPLPYASARDPTNIWSTHDQLYPVQSSIAIQKMPVITKVLSELYGLENHIRTPDAVAERVDQLVRRTTSTTV
jgi:hypothetical protein